MSNETLNNKPYSSKEFWRFLIPSILGLFLFIIPLPYKGDFSIGVGMMASGQRLQWASICLAL